MLSGLTNYLPESALTVFDNLEFFIRIVLAAALGALVGLERSKRQKEAGVRTHCIIACTSALFMILSKYSFIDVTTIDGLRGADPARIAAQVSTIENDGVICHILRRFLIDASETPTSFAITSSVKPRRFASSKVSRSHAPVISVFSILTIFSILVRNHISIFVISCILPREMPL
mgnify:CR=1 FL=1